MVDRPRFRMPAKLFDRQINDSVESIAIPLEERLEIGVGTRGEEVFRYPHLPLAEPLLDVLPSRALIGIREILLPSLHDEGLLSIILRDRIGNVNHRVPQFAGQQPFFLRRKVGNSRKFFGDHAKGYALRKA